MTFRAKIRIEGYNTADYINRLRVMREIEGDTQREFAERLGMDMKRWNNYERGFPMPRDVAIKITTTIKGPTPDWIWFGMKGNLLPKYRAEIERVQAEMAEQLDAEKLLVLAKTRVKLLTDKRRGKRRQPSRRKE